MASISTYRHSDILTHPYNTPDQASHQRETPLLNELAVSGETTRWCTAAEALEAALPALVRWRLLMFYSPFYVFKDFPVAKTAQDCTGYVDMGLHMKLVYRAQVAAKGLLSAVSQRLSQLDIAAALEGYRKWRGCQSYHRRLIAVLHTPTLRTSDLDPIRAASRNTGIPEQQAVRALLLYQAYLNLEEEIAWLDLSPTQAMPDTLKPTAVGLADQMDYARLSRIVKDDLSDIDSCEIYASTERPEMEAPSRASSDRLMHYDAVQRCRDQFFAAIYYDVTCCGCGIGVCSRRQRGSYPTAHSSSAIDKASGIDRMSSRSRKASRQLDSLSSKIASIAHSAVGVHLRCSHRGNKGMLRFKLSDSEQKAVEGKPAFMAQVLLLAPGVISPRSKPCDRAARDVENGADTRLKLPKKVWVSGKSGSKARPPFKAVLEILVEESE